MLKLKHLSIHELGSRDNQEDSIFPEVGSCGSDIFMVCDGMGGYEAGEVASAAVCKALVDNAALPFEDALDKAYDALDAAADGPSKMGTTLAYLRFEGSKAFVAHIGDSRVYQIRPSERRIVFATRDHSLVNNLVDIGEITPEEARTHPRKNVVTRAMQPHGQRFAADVVELEDVRCGDYFLVCSDGITETLEDANIINILSKMCTFRRKMNIMLGVTQSSRDNHSAHLIKVLHT